MRIFAAVSLVLWGCASVPVSSDGQLRLQDEMALLAMVDLLREPSAPEPAVVDVVQLRKTLRVSGGRMLLFSDLAERDSLWLADPAQVARCTEDVMPRCLVIRILQFKRSGDLVEMRVLWMPYSGCGGGITNFQVKTSASGASVVHKVITEVGDCGMRSGKPLPPDSSGALQISKQ